jgi:hypothetical protein
MRTYEADKKEGYIRIKLAADMKTRTINRAQRQGMTLSRYLRALIERDLATGKASRS